jgi:small subunit ribosomal protein S2
VEGLKRAYDFVRQIVSEGKKILFVGTKKQAQKVIEEEAKRCGMFYINQRWLGGTLTNFKTIKQSIARLKEISRMESDGKFEQLPKKEVALLLDRKKKLEKYLGGIVDMDELPGAVFFIDTRKESIGVAEARKVGIPIIAIVDTNSDPDEVDYCIPGNDDAIKGTKLITSIIADAVCEGSEILAEQKAKEEEEEELQEEEEQNES